jgi:hypothetical protein
VKKEAISLIEKAKKIGFKEQKDGAKLFGHVPHVAPQAWLNVVYPPATEGEILKIEKELEDQIPKPYKDFLVTEANGLSLFSSSLELYGYRRHYNRKSMEFLPFDLITPNLYERPGDASDYQFFIGSYNWDGSLVYMDKKTFKIHRCDRESVKPLNTWKALGDFLLKEVKRLSTLFDQKGMEKNSNTPTIPGENK